VEKIGNRISYSNFALLQLVIENMINEKSKYCMELLKKAGVNNPENYISIINSLHLIDNLDAIEFVCNTDGSIKKLRFGFFLSSSTSRYQ
jgi:hypothetical protein